MGNYASLRDRLFSVEGKVALVTGGSSGIGRMLAETLVQHGARVTISALEEDDCDAVAAELSAVGECRAICADLSTNSGVASLAQEFTRQHDELHILVNAAGINHVQSIDEFEEQAWDRVMDVNLKAPFFLTQALLPLLRRVATPEDPARIVNIGSGHAFKVPAFETFAYNASKAGVHHLTRSLASRLAREHIAVNAIAPGVFPSRRTAVFTDDEVKAITSRIPFGRYGEMDDIGGALLYLCSPAGRFITATVLSVDGGWVGAS